MPSRKSNVSTATNGAADEGSPVASRNPRESVGMSVEDLSLPRTMISRLSKGVLPSNTQIQKDALSALSKSATVFVNYIATNAMDNAQGAGKKTIQPQDVLVALKDTEFEFMIPRIEAELKKYNTVQCDKRNSYRRKVKADKAAANAPTDPSDPNSTAQAAADGLTSTVNSSVANSPTAVTAAAPASNPSGNDDAERPSKKARRDPSGAAASDSDDVDEDEDEEDVDDGAEDANEDDEGEVDEDEEMEDEDDEDDEEEEGVEGGEREDALETEEERIQRQIERDEALDEGGESD